MPSDRSRVSSESPARLEVRLLGAVEVILDGRRLGAFNSLRLQRFLALITLRRYLQHRSRLAFELWPDSNERQARTNLRKLLHDFRHSLPDIGEFVQIDNEIVRWIPTGPSEVDVLRFRDCHSCWRSRTRRAPVFGRPPSSLLRRLGHGRASEASSRGVRGPGAVERRGCRARRPRSDDQACPMHHRPGADRRSGRSNPDGSTSRARRPRRGAALLPPVRGGARARPRAGTGRGHRGDLPTAPGQHTPPRGTAGRGRGTRRRSAVRGPRPRTGPAQPGMDRGAGGEGPPRVAVRRTGDREVPPRPGAGTARSSRGTRGGFGSGVRGGGQTAVGPGRRPPPIGCSPEPHRHAGHGLEGRARSSPPRAPRGFPGTCTEPRRATWLSAIGCSMQ